ncbi:MAG: hypothetical protein WAL61_18425 [Acidimicrobiales bacterium]
MICAWARFRFASVDKSAARFAAFVEFELESLESLDDGEDDDDGGVVVVVVVVDAAVVAVSAWNAVSCIDGCRRLACDDEDVVEGGTVVVVGRVVVERGGLVVVVLGGRVVVACGGRVVVDTGWCVTVAGIVVVVVDDVGGVGAGMLLSCAWVADI